MTRNPGAKSKAPGELARGKNSQASTLPAVIEPRLPAYQVGDVPALVADLGAKAKKRFTAFFTDNIRNRNTREAYFRAAFQFFEWCDAHKLAVETVESFHVSAYIEELGQEKSKPTVKQHLAAIRMLYDWLVVGQIVPVKPRPCRSRSQAYCHPGANADS